MSEKVQYVHHPRKPAGSPEGGRFAPGKAVKVVMPLVSKPRTIVPSPSKRTGGRK
jgi:hypothetical protein